MPYEWISESIYLMVYYNNIFSNLYTSLISQALWGREIKLTFLKVHVKMHLNETFAKSQESH